MKASTGDGHFSEVSHGLSIRKTLTFVLQPVVTRDSYMPCSPLKDPARHIPCPIEVLAWETAICLRNASGASITGTMASRR
jgi:hypothetical protein